MTDMSRFASISSLLSPAQLRDLGKVREALDKDPMCLEHHKAHVKDKTRAVPVQTKEDTNA